MLPEQTTGGGANHQTSQCVQDHHLIHGRGVSASPLSNGRSKPCSANAGQLAPARRLVEAVPFQFVRLGSLIRSVKRSIENNWA